MKRVLVVGAGALGSHVVMLLRNAAELVVVDFDHVEQRNVLAQFHSHGAVRKNKAAALAGLMQLVYGVKVFGIPVKLTRENAREVLGPRVSETVRRPSEKVQHVTLSLVIDCVDNAEGRHAA
jgi:molybdopterin/thiamine biosynthesis adenylyltransferase